MASEEITGRILLEKNVDEMCHGELLNHVIFTHVVSSYAKRHYDGWLVVEAGEHQGQVACKIDTDNCDDIYYADVAWWEPGGGWKGGGEFRTLVPDYCPGMCDVGNGGCMAESHCFGYIESEQTEWTNDYGTYTVGMHRHLGGKMFECTVEHEADDVFRPYQNYGYKDRGKAYHPYWKAIGSTVDATDKPDLQGGNSCDSPDQYTLTFSGIEAAFGYGCVEDIDDCYSTAGVTKEFIEGLNGEWVVDRIGCTHRFIYEDDDFKIELDTFHNVPGSDYGVYVEVTWKTVPEGLAACIISSILKCGLWTYWCTDVFFDRLFRGWIEDRECYIEGASCDNQGYCAASGGGDPCCVGYYQTGTPEDWDIFIIAQTGGGSVSIEAVT